MTDKLEKTVCELFAGVGGFRIGLDKNGWKTVFGNQWEPKDKNQYAYQCYKAHFPDVNEYSNTDISQVPANKIPNHTLLVGGFPCQDYSVARTKSEGIHGKKGVLWWEILRIVKTKKPPFILLENVDRLLKSPASQRGRDFGVMLATLNKEGYTVEWRVINAAEYGFPQRRRRTFIFATRNNTLRAKGLRKSDPIDLITNDGFFAKCFPVESETTKLGTINLPSVKDETSLLEISNSFAFNFENSGIMENGRITTAKIAPKNLKQKNLSTLLEKNVGPEYNVPKTDMPIWKAMKGPKRIERVSKSGHAYTFSEGGIAFPDPIDRPARTMLTSEGKKNRSTHIIKDPQSGKLRKLTPKECERISGFPTNWTKGYMPDNFRYFCMGNALVVGLIEKMGNELSNIIEKE